MFNMISPNRYINRIVDNQATVLKAIQGSNIWSGQNIQQLNTLAIAFSMAKEMFSIGGKYEWVTISYLVGFIVPFPFYFLYRWTSWKIFSYLNLSIILWYMGWLFVGINSSILSYFVIGKHVVGPMQDVFADLRVTGFAAQWWLRKYRPQWFIQYNYILSAALDGGTQVMVFILTFAVFGGSGKARPFP